MGVAVLYFRRNENCYLKPLDANGCAERRATSFEVLEDQLSRTAKRLGRANRILPVCGSRGGLGVRCLEICHSKSFSVIWECRLGGKPDAGARSIHERKRSSATAGGRYLGSLASCGHEHETGNPFDEEVSERGSRALYSLPGSETCSNCAFHGIYGRPRQSAFRRSLCTIPAICSARRGGTALPTW